MKPERISLFLAICSITSIGIVDGFSAKLHRPWDLTTDYAVSSAGRMIYQSYRIYYDKEASRRTGRTSTAAIASTSTTALSSTPKDGENTGQSPDEAEPSLSPARLFIDSSVQGQETGPNASGTNLNKYVNGVKYEKAPSMISSLGPLFQLTRPANFPGVVLLHLLGSYLSLLHTGQTHLLKRILFQTPSMWVVLAALLLTSSTSMVVNDYYDKKLGRDRDKITSPLVSGRVTLAIVRQFLNYLYAVALLCVAFVPGIPARMSVVVGLMLTFFYTKHVKPRTWLKTLVCASLISFSPFTSGSAALKVASEVGQGPWGTIGVLAVPNLWRLVAMLFFGVSGREIMMDILDTNDDKLSGVRTIPVKYGRKFASTVAMVCYMLSGICVIGGPLNQLVAQIGDLPMVWSTMKTVLFANSEGITRRLLFAAFGSLMLIGRGLHIFKTKGEDNVIIDKTVNEAQIAMVLAMVSFV